MGKIIEDAGGPWHSFRLALDTDDPRFNCHIAAPSDAVEVVSIDDDLIGYIYDTLKLIPTINPASPNNWRGFGLNRHGPTMIRCTGADIAWNVFDCWRRLFLMHPRKMKLYMGRIREVDGDNVESELDRFVVYDREKLTDDFKKIINYLEIVKKGRHCLLHNGI